MRYLAVAVAVLAVIPVFVAGGAPQAQAPRQPRGADSSSRARPRAGALHAGAIVVDTHDDTTERLLYEDFDLGVRHDDGHVDIPRMREGGLGALFFSIWVPSALTGPAAVKRALDEIDAVREAVAHHPKDLVLATSAAEVRRAHAAGRIAALLGVEGGHMIDDDLGVLRLMAALGVRYLTLTHSGPTNWADSSGAPPKHNGLTDFGRKVVRELNRQGVMIDVSHVSDKTFEDVLALSRAPLIASHSSLRAISDHPRNMTDQMLKGLAQKGGVIQINFDSEFLSQEMRDAVRAHSSEIAQRRKTVAARCGENDACSTREMERQINEMSAAGTLPHVSWEKILEHIDHAVKVAGIDHVGIGSDFDGAFMPEGMEDVSRLPKITAGLRKMGYSETAIRKILGGNTLSLMEEVDRVGRTMRAEQPGLTR